jgi:integrase/recombinase XerD
MVILHPKEPDNPRPARQGDKEGIVLITPECAKTLHKYLEVRPDLCIDRRSYLFFMDYGRPWDRVALHRMFVLTKKRARIERPGGVHVFGRHTPATLMIAHGAYIRVVQAILRHTSILTTLRYTHANDTTKRTLCDKFFTV